jgi:hypothetical protein
VRRMAHDVYLQVWHFRFWVRDAAMSGLFLTPCPFIIFGFWFLSSSRGEFGRLGLGDTAGRLLPTKVGRCIRGPLCRCVVAAVTTAVLCVAGRVPGSSESEGAVVWRKVADALASSVATYRV